MKLKMLLVLLSTLAASASFAQAPAAAASTAKSATPPAAAPATAAAVTALCKDGTNFSGDSKKGACSGHKGVKTWTTAEATKAETKAEAKADTKAAGAKASAPMATAAAGGGAGKVWVNSKSNVYHCPSDKYYGKTKEGSYMSEADAKAKGAHADHGKSCA